jgi:UDP-glucuronate 4-epimerase
VDDIATGTLAALHYLTTDHRRQTAVGGPVFEIINLGSDQPVMLMEAIRLVEELVGKKAQIEFRPRHPADVPATWADIGKAEWLLGWRPQTPFRDGVARLVEWYQENRAWAKEIQTG